jgi:hypothetical protein
VSVGFVYMSTLTPDSSYLDVLWPLLVISSGFGLCTAPTTSAIMTAAPDAKQGVASAVNDATRNSSYLVMAAIVGVAAILIPVFAPGRDGKRLRMLRGLSRRAE